MTEPLLTHPARGSASRDDVEPLTADLRRLHVTVTNQFLKKLDVARDGLSHAIPGATTEQVLEAALDLLIERQARRRGQLRRPRSGALPEAQPAATFPVPPERLDLPATEPHFAEPVHRREGPRDTIPAAVRRAVWKRDQGRCTWPLDGGGTCGSTHRLELDHVVPWARGGEPTEVNLRLVCHRHNVLAAKLAFGNRVMASYVSQ